MKIFRSGLGKKISLFLALFFIVNIITPTVSLALTGGPAQQDTQGYQPVNATDNVSLVAGSFNYTVPVTSIPQYPMAYSYRSGLGMDDEATAFGFGGNCHPGAINRSLAGVPDDVKDGSILYDLRNQARQGLGVGGSFGFNIIDADVVTIGANVTHIIGYDNYSGCFVAWGPGVSLNLGGLTESTKNSSLNLSIGLYSDSRTSSATLSMGAGVGYGITSNMNAGFNANFSLSAGTKNSNNTSFSAALATNKGQGAAMISSGEPLFINSNKKGLENIMTFRGSGGDYGYAFNASFPIPYVPFLTGHHTQYRIKTPSEIARKWAYGFMYLGDGYNRGKANHTADAYAENEDPYNDRAADGDINPVHLQRDYFNITGGGIGGTMQLYNSDHGAISRNAYKRSIRTWGSITSKNERRETQPWVATMKSSLNKNIDILTVLKNQPAIAQVFGDFNPTSSFFTSENVNDMTGEEYRFASNPKFKMRGDMAGEYLISKGGNKKNKSDAIDLVNTNGPTNDDRLFFFGVENKMPIYMPSNSTVRKNSDLDASAIKSASDIKTIKVSDLISQSAKSYLNLNRSKIDESFYTHTKAAVPGTPLNSYFELNNYIQNFNLIEHLDGLKTTYGGKVNVDNLIAGFEVKNREGMKYIFNLPAFCKPSKFLAMSGRNSLPPVSADGEYHSFRDGGYNERNKFVQNNEYIYPYAWNLTAIVGPDYIDFDDIPGPSNGDLGYWVKFKYVRACDNYRWRFPFEGMEHHPGALHLSEDDKYTVTTGEKEIYYLYQVESSTHIAEYTYGKRFDAVEAANYYNGDARNEISGTYANSNYTASKKCAFEALPECELYTPEHTGKNLGSDFQYAATNITLYKKHFDGNNSETRDISASKGKKIKSTKFFYDYSICPGVPNNVQFKAGTTISDAVPISSVPYHIKNGSGSGNIETGKLTLRKIQHSTFDEDGTEITMPAYDLAYAFDETGAAVEANPSYDSQQKDGWGNFSAKNKDTQPLNVPGVSSSLNYYHNYSEISKVQADKNAQAFTLKSIGLPTGGKVEVTFEAKDYGYVQDKAPFDMRRIVDMNNSGSNPVVTNLKVDITDLKEQNSSFSLSNIVSVNQELYAEAAFNQIENPKVSDLFMTSGNYFVDNINPVTETSGGRTYQWISLRDKTDPGHTPLYTNCNNFVYTASMRMVSLRQTTFNHTGECAASNDTYEKYDNGTKDNISSSSIKLMSNFVTFFKNKSYWKGAYETCYGVPCNKIYPFLSFLRTPTLRGRYTGSRVKQIVYKDGFNYATQANGSAGISDNSYGVSYSYTDGSKSSGVATVEPFGGASAIIDINNTKGAGFMSAPFIYYSKTTVEPLYKNPETSSSLTGDKVSRNKGKSVYTFFTPKDDEVLKFKNNFDDGVYNFQPNLHAKFSMFAYFIWLHTLVKKPKWARLFIPHIPIMVPANINWDRHDSYKVKSYAYMDNDDMLGQLKSVVQYNSSGSEESSTTYRYYGNDESVKVYNSESQTSGSNQLDPAAVTNIRPGRIEQMWSDSYYTQEDKITQVPGLFFICETDRSFNFVTQKYIYQPSILKEVETKVKGQRTIVRSTGFDMLSGATLSTETEDSYGNKKISYSVPAYWKYPEMKANNILTPVTASYSYVQQVNTTTAPASADLTGAAVTEWSKTGYDIVDAYVPTKTAPATGKFRYEYKNVTGIKNIYNTAQTLPEPALFLSKNATLYKPYRDYVYKTELLTDGRFDPIWGFTDFNFTSGATQNASWLLTNTYELFDAWGNVVQTKDVLSKYAAAHFGYSNSYSVYGTTNSQYAGSAYESGENTYLNYNTTTVLLDDKNVSLVNAKVVKKCLPSTTDVTLATSIVSNSLSQFYKVTKPTTPVYDVPFAKFNVVYNNQISREFYVTMNNAGKILIISNRGEAFEGFFQINNTTNPNEVYLVFDPATFATPITSGLVLDGSYPAQGYVTTKVTSLPSCVPPSLNVTYKIPYSDCISEVHSGQYAFTLGAGLIGTKATINKSGLQAAEYNRKYTAMVWVKNSSPAGTKLYADVKSSGTLLTSASSDIATPYLVAGNWSLLRIDLEAATVNAGTSLEVYVKNTATRGEAIYDDLLVKPYHASFKGTLYDQVYGRVLSEINDNHFVSDYKYDNRGRTVISLTEVQNKGKQVVKHYKYNEQKGK